MLPAGQISHETLLGWYSLADETITMELSNSKFAPLAQYFMIAGQRGTMTQFGKAADHMILDHLQQARFVLRGPEIPLAYLIARLLRNQE